MVDVVDVDVAWSLADVTTFFGSTLAIDSVPFSPGCVIEDESDDDDDDDDDDDEDDDVIEDESDDDDLGPKIFRPF